MSNNEDFSDLGAISADEDFADLGAIQAEEQKPVKPERSFFEGVDEASALGEDINDPEASKAMQLGAMQGLTFESYPAIVGAGAGIKALFGPEKILEEYNKARQQQLKEVEELKQKKPTDFAVGQGLGGLAQGLAIPATKIEQGLGSVSKGLSSAAKSLNIPIPEIIQSGELVTNAGLAQKVLGVGKEAAKQAGIGAAYGTATALGQTASEGGNLGENLMENVLPMSILGGAIPVAGAVVGGIASKLKGPLSLIYDKLPERLKLYVQKKANEGVDISTPEFAESLKTHLDDTRKEIEESVTGYTSKQDKKIQELEKKQLEYKQALEQRQRDIDDQNLKLKNKEKEIEENIQSQFDLDVEAKQEQDPKLLKEIQAKKIDYAKKLQSDVTEINKNLKKQFSDVNNQVKQTGYTFDNRQIISDLFEDVKTKFGQSSAEEFSKLLNQNSTLQDFNELKQKLYQMRKSLANPDPVLSEKFNRAYGQLSESYLKGLNEVDSKVANNLRNLNNKQHNFYDLQDFVQSNKIQKIEDNLADIPDQLSERNSIDLASTPTTRTINKYIKSDTDASAISEVETQKFLENLKIASPEESPRIMNEFEDTFNKIRELEKQVKQTPMSISKRKNMVPELKEIPENVRLNKKDLDVDQKMIKNEMDSLSNEISLIQDETKTNLIPDLQGDAFSVRKKLETLTENYEPTSTTSKEFIKNVKELKGEEYAKALETKLQEYQKLKTASNEFKTKGFGATKMGSAIGAAIGSGIGGVPGAAIGAVSGGAFGNTLAKIGVNGLAKMNPQEVSAIASKLARSGSVGQTYANELLSAFDKQGVARFAVLNNLMQQPGFRELLDKKQETTEVEDGNED